MKERKIKKMMKGGTLVRILGTPYIYMCMGGFRPGTHALKTFNGIDIKLRVHTICGSGNARLATPKECQLYWNIMQGLTGNLAIGEKIEYIPESLKQNIPLKNNE